MTLGFFAMVAGAYLVGSMPFGIIVGHSIFGVDPRTVGSGNIGTANSMRAFGATGAALVLVGDVLKGALPTFVAVRFLGDPWLVAAVGLATVVGHNWSIFLRFTGGKGVATTLGVIIVLSLPAAVVFGVVWFAVAGISRYSSLASMAGSVAVPAAMFFLRSPMPYVWYGIVAAGLVVWRHADNIKRLAAGTELKIGTKNPT
jgi:glycerol-3-phosphate acyltransferase PlsY